jgi:group I intron endonuclease
MIPVNLKCCPFYDIINYKDKKEVFQMIGIYCWTNKINGKKYIGQSVDIYGRKKAHIYSAGKYGTLFSKALYKYGFNNFDFEVLENTTEDKLDEREIYYIKEKNSYYLDGHGYNMTRGGQGIQSGEANPNAHLTDSEVLEIRNRIFINNEYPKEVYADYANKIGYDRFWSAFHGETFKNVDTSMIKKIKTNNHGSKNPKSKLNEDDVLEIRKRIHINNEQPIDVYEDYKDIISYSAYTKAYSGATWKKVDASMIKPVKAKKKGKSKAKLTKEDIQKIRYEYENNIKTLSELYNEYSFVTNITIKRVVDYKTWSHIKPVSTIPEA